MALQGTMALRRAFCAFDYAVCGIMDKGASRELKAKLDMHCQRLATKRQCIVGRIWGNKKGRQGGQRIVEIDMDNL